MTLVWHTFVALAAVGGFAALFFVAMLSFLEWRSSTEVPVCPCHNAPEQNFRWNCQLCGALHDAATTHA